MKELELKSKKYFDKIKNGQINTIIINDNNVNTGDVLKIHHQRYGLLIKINIIEEIIFADITSEQVEFITPIFCKNRSVCGNIVSRIEDNKSTNCNNCILNNSLEYFQLYWKEQYELLELDDSYNPLIKKITFSVIEVND